MKLLFILINILLLINICFSYEAKLYQLNENTNEWEIVRIKIPFSGTEDYRESHPPNFLFKQIVQPTSTMQFKLELSEKESVPKKDVTMEVNGGLSSFFFRDKFGEKYTQDHYLFNTLKAEYCGHDNFDPYYFNYTCMNSVMPCSIASRINYGYFDHCKK